MHDSGRSMIEMLGVLAIIGVLSVGGIMGYSYAMTKYRSNKIASELNLLNNQIAITLKQSRNSNFELMLGEEYDKGYLTSTDYPFDFGCGDNSKTDVSCFREDMVYFMELSGVSKNMCSSLVQMTQHLPYLVKQTVNGDEDNNGTSCYKEENTLFLLFDAENDEFTTSTSSKMNISETKTEMITSTSTTTTMT